MSLSDSQKWLLLAAIGGLSLLLYLLSPILMPFFAAALLAYLGDPIADRLEALKLPRTLAVVIVFVSLLLLLLALLLLLVPMLEHQISYLLSNFPKYVDIVQNQFLPGIANRLGIDPATIDLASIKTAISQHFDKTGGVMAKVLASVTSSGVALVAWLANLVLIPVVTFYLLRDWDIMTGRIREMLPRQYEPVIVRLAGESDQVLAAFLRGQFMVMLALGIIYSTGLWFVDLKLALLIGMLAGLVSFVPYLGFIIGILAASIAVLLQTGEVMQLVPVFIVFAVGQALEGMVLTPLLVGDRIGLHPVAVIFAVLAGGQLFGFVGILLALPVAAVLAVLLRHMHLQYRASNIFNDGAA